MLNKNEGIPKWAIAAVILVLLLVFYFSAVPRNPKVTTTRDTGITANAAKIAQLELDLDLTQTRLEYIQRQRYQDWIEKVGWKEEFRDNPIPACVFKNPEFKETYEISLVTDDFTKLTMKPNYLLYLFDDLTHKCMLKSPTQRIACEDWCAEGLNTAVST